MGGSAVTQLPEVPPSLQKEIREDVSGFCHHLGPRRQRSILVCNHSKCHPLPRTGKYIIPSSSAAASPAVYSTFL